MSFVSLAKTTLDNKEQLEPVTFSCSACGECCNGWNIFLQRERAEYLLERPWVQALLTERGLTLEKLNKSFYVLPQDNERYCVFLGEHKQCLIEVNEGRDIKPEECKRFPFAVVADRQGNHYYDSSAFCKNRD